MSTLPAVASLAPAPPDDDQGGVNLLRVVTWGGDAAAPLDSVCLVSFPQELWLWPDVPYGWGRDPREGVTLALCILDLWRPAEHGEVVTEWQRPLGCSHLAYYACWGFWAELIRPLDFWGAHLPAKRIRAWLDRHAHHGQAHKWGMAWAAPHDVWPPAAG